MVLPAFPSGGLVPHVFLMRTAFIQFHKRLFEKVIMILLLGSVELLQCPYRYEKICLIPVPTLKSSNAIEFLLPSQSQCFPYCLSLSLYRCRSQCFSHKIHYDNIFVIKCIIIGLFFPFVTSMLTPYHLL